MNKYYTYIYIDPTTKVPFYVGYGHGDRKMHHLLEAQHGRVSYNPHKTNKIKQLLRNGLEPLIVLVDSCISKDQAQELETFLIDFIGTDYLKTGPLTNLTLGGDGGDTLSNHPSKDIIFSKIKHTREGKVWWTNGVVAVFDKTPPSPEYWRGFSNSRKSISRSNRLKGSSAVAAMHWINNGLVEKMIEKTDTIEHGWVVGRLNAFADSRPNPKGKKWFNDGVRDYFLHPSDTRSNNLIVGRLRMSGGRNPNFKCR